MSARHLLPAALLAAAASLAAEPTPGARLETQLERIFSKKEYEPRTFGPAHWIAGGAAYTTVEPSTAPPGAQDVVRYETGTGKRRVVVPASLLVPGAGRPPLGIEEYTWSKDENRLLVFTNARKVWRRKTRGDYWVLDLKTRRLRKLGGDAPEASLMFAKLSPDGLRAAYVRGGDLYVEDVDTGLLVRLTQDGSETVVNGTSDWVYEEEFDLRDGFRWSADGRDIAFWRFDSSGVGLVPLVNNTDATYPTVTWLRYPKAGTPNSKVQVGVVAAAGGAPRFIDIPGGPDHYLPRMEWTVGAPGELVIQRLDRPQNTIEVWTADARTGAARKLHGEDDAAWIDVVDDWRFIAGGRDLLWSSERDGWRRLWAVPREAAPPRLLTPGAVDVMSVVGLDTSGAAYVVAAPEDATSRYLYRSRLDGYSALERVTPAGQPGTHAYVLAPDGRHAFHTWSTLDRPPVTSLVKLPSHQVVRVLEPNRAVTAALAPHLGSVEIFQVDVGDGARLDGWMLKPPGFDPAKRYPLLLHVYGDPGGVAAVNGWRGARGLFHHALAEAGYVVACVDNRGTPAPRGREWRKLAYRQVGILAARDQAAAVRRLLADRSYLDPERVGVWGWSGGGAATLHLMFRSPDLFKVGLAVAPLVDLTLYDTVYQERYTGLPQENPDAYRDGSALHVAEGLTGKLLLVHGTGDDNVHIQGTERLLNRLVELGKSFDFMEYPNRSHSISEGEGTSLHVHALLARYLTTHLPAGPR